MKLRHYNFIRLVTACVIFTLALGPLAANAGIVMQCPQMPNSPTLTCDYMHMATPAHTVHQAGSSLPPCCRHHASRVTASLKQDNVLGQSARRSCVIVTSTASDAISQSIVPTRAEAVTSTSTVALPPAPTCRVLPTDSITASGFTHYAAAVPLSDFARVHGSRAPPTSNS